MKADIEALKRIAEAANRGEWIAGHLCRDDHSCDCRYVLCEAYMGSICEISVDNGLPVSDGGNDSPPLEEAKANQRHIATFDPPTCLALLSELASLRSEREGMREGNSSVSPLASPSVVSPSDGQQLRTGKSAR